MRQRPSTQCTNLAVLVGASLQDAIATGPVEAQQTYAGYPPAAAGYPAGGAPYQPAGGAGYPPAGGVG